MKTTTASTSRRAALLGITISLFSLPACGATRMTVTLDVVYFNYLDRPIFDAFIDGKGGDSSRPYPTTGGSTITGVSLELGPKKITWILDGPEGTPRNGEKITAKNSPQLVNVSSDARYLAVHIYPDETAELFTSRHFPRATEKGIAVASKRGH